MREEEGARRSKEQVVVVVVVVAAVLVVVMLGTAMRRLEEIKAQVRTRADLENGRKRAPASTSTTKAAA